MAKKLNKMNPSCNSCENRNILWGCLCITFTFPLCFSSDRREVWAGGKIQEECQTEAEWLQSMLRWERVTHHSVLDKCRLNLLACCLFCRKWSKRWPIGWWGSFGGPFSPPPCHRPNWIFMEAGRPRRSSLEPGWPKSYTLSGAQDLFKHVSHWLWALITWLHRAVTHPMPLLSRGCHEALSALEIPNDLLQVIQDLLLELRVHCLMVTLLHTTDGEGGLCSQEL